MKYKVNLLTVVAIAIQIQILFASYNIQEQQHNRESLEQQEQASLEGLPKTRRRIDVVSTTESASESKIILGDRPSTVQAAVDGAFENLVSFGFNPEGGGWRFNGDYCYSLFGLKDDLLLKNVVQTGENEIYIIDVGCGSGVWGTNAFSVLSQDDECQKLGKKIYIFSITGGNECEARIQNKENVSHHMFSQFKIENIDEEFEKREIDLKSKVALIVSRMTLQHLVDPWGTLKRLYGLLKPGQGMLISSGFYFDIGVIGKEDFVILLNIPANRVCAFGSVLYFPGEFFYSYSALDTWNIWKILASSNAISLFQCKEAQSDFLLKRTDEQGLEIPIGYTGEVIKANMMPGYIASGLITRFKLGLIKNDEPFYFKPCKLGEKSEKQMEDGVRAPCSLVPYFCGSESQLAKKLFMALKSQGVV